MEGIGFYAFGRFVAYYGLMIAAGILVNIPVAIMQVRRFRLEMNDLIIISGLCGLFGAAGAKILYLATVWESIDLSRLLEPAYLAGLMSGGLVFLGGALGAVAAVALCGRVLHIPMRPYIQACTCCIPLGHAFGRVGCYLVGCCYGVPYSGPFAVVYASSPFAPRGVPLFPVQLAEAAVELALGVCLLAFSRKLKGNSALPVYLLAYSTARFFLEFLRYDEARGGIGGVSTSQLLSILLFAASLSVLVRGKRRTARRERG